jgi:hypothetical protein
MAQTTARTATLTPELETDISDSEDRSGPTTPASYRSESEDQRSEKAYKIKKRNRETDQSSSGFANEGERQPKKARSTKKRNREPDYTTSSRKGERQLKRARTPKQHRKKRRRHSDSSTDTEDNDDRPEDEYDDEFKTDYLRGRKPKKRHRATREDEEL